MFKLYLKRVGLEVYFARVIIVFGWNGKKIFMYTREEDDIL